MHIICILFITIALWNNVIYLTIIQRRVIRLSATVIAFVSSIAQIAVLVGRRFISRTLSIFSVICSNQILRIALFLPDSVRLLPICQCYAFLRLVN